MEVLLDSTADDGHREMAAIALGRLGDDVFSLLREAVRVGNADHRWWAARALAALGGASSVSCLIDTLSDPDPDVRACAVLGLGALTAREAITPLIQLLADGSVYVGRIAGNALIQIGQPAVPALIETLGSGSAAARAGAARALIPLQHHDAIPALFAVLDDESALAAHYAGEALERMGVGIVYFKP